MEDNYEVLIVGGGPAGLSAAMTLGRLSQPTLVVDDGRPRNAPSSHINNFPPQDGIHPQVWLQQTRENLKKYESARFHAGRVETIEKSESGFTAKLQNGETLKVKKVILAEGVKDKMMPVPNFEKFWGKGIYHCPFCHGFEVKNQKLGFVIESELGFHTLVMIYELSKDLILFTNGKINPTEDQRALLKRKNIVLIETKIKEFKAEGEKIKALITEDEKSYDREAFFYSPSLPMKLKGDLGIRLGCELNEFGLYKVNEMGMTTVEGVYAAGDNMKFGSVLISAATGVTAGSAAIAHLLSAKLHDE